MASYSALSAATTSDAQALLFIPVMQQEQENYLFMRGKWNEIVNLDLPENRAYVDNIMALIQEGIGYDLFSEHMTDKISVHDGYVEAFGFRYNTLIFPRMFFINDQTKKLIEKLRAHNVRTVFTHMIPGVNVDTGMSFDFGFNMKALPDDANVESDGCVYFIKPSAYPESLPPQEAEPEELSDADYAASLASYMSSMKLPDLSVCRAAMREVVGGKVLNVCADNGIYITRRTAPGAEVYFIANDKPTAANVEIDALPGMHLLSHATCHEVPYTVENGRMRLTLGGFEMIAIVRDPESTEMPVSTAQPSVCDHTVTLEAPYTFAPADGNYLPLNYEMYNPVTDAWDICP